MTRHFIVRHGNTFDPGDTVLRIGARTDLPLSSSGLAQAERLGGWFSDEVGDAGAYLQVGPLKRTRQSAEVIAAAIDASLETRIEPKLREIDYGPDEGVDEARVRERLGVAALEAWERDSVVPDGWTVDRSALVSFWTKQFQQQSERCLIYVTSAGVARFALEAVGRAPSKLRTGGVGLIEVSGDQVDLAFWDKRPEDLRRG